MKKSALFLLFVSLTSAAQAQSMFRGNAAHTGVYPGAAPREFHRVKWKFPTGARVVGSAVMQANIIYFGSDDGNVYAVDAKSGRQIWKSATRGPVPCTPAIDHVSCANRGSERPTSNVARRTPNSEDVAYCHSSLVTRYFRLKIYHEEGSNASGTARKLAWFF